MDIGKPIRKIDVVPERKTAPVPPEPVKEPAAPPKKKEPVPV